MRIRFYLTALAAMLAFSSPIAAQQSQGYKFLQAVRDSKGADVERMLNEPGTVVVNTHDTTTGEGALHIVIKRGDSTYLAYLLSRGADANLRDNKGNSPLMAATTEGEFGMMSVLIGKGANVNLANSSGETPLIRAVQRRDLAMVRLLLNAGADPDKADVIAGMSARAYAKQDTRTPAIAKIIDAAPKADKKAVSGPPL